MPAYAPWVQVPTVRLARKTRGVSLRTHPQAHHPQDNPVMSAPISGEKPHPSRKKTQVLRFRATPEENRRIRELAQMAGMKISQFIIISTIHGRPSATRRSDPALIRHIALIGNNLNQIARACNRCARGGEFINLTGVLIQLKRINRQLASYASENESQG